MGKRHYILSVVFTLTLAVNPLLSVSFATPVNPTTKSKTDQALAQYNAAKQQVQNLQKKIGSTDQKMNAIFQSLEQVETRQAQTKKRLDQVLVRLYTSGQNNLGVQLLGSQSFPQFFGRLETIRLLMENDYRVFNQYKAQAQQIEQSKANIKKEVAELKPLLLAAEQKEKKLQTQYKALTVELNALRVEQKKKPTRSVVISSPTKLPDQSWLNKARAMIGTVNYQFGADNYPYFDCSSWTQYVFRNYRGTNIPRTSGEQATVGAAVSKSNIQPGDLDFFQGTSKAGISHVGIALGNGYYISNRNAEKDLQIDSLNDPYSKAHYWGARRVN
jgi:cell wall-associated NlpC family hydrolase